MQRIESLEVRPSRHRRIDPEPGGPRRPGRVGPRGPDLRGRRLGDAGGRTSCVLATLSHDPTENERTFRLRDPKYAVQRLGRRIGPFGDGPGPQTVTLRLDPCSSGPMGREKEPQ